MQSQPSTNRPQHEQSQQTLAHRVASALGDLDNLQVYERYCRTYPQSAIERALDDTLVVPKSKIRHSQIGLFTFLMKKYSNESK